MTDFRELNKCLVNEKHPLPLIDDGLDDIMISVQNFLFTTALDLSMGYYAMILAALSRKYCVIIIPWGLYEYTALPMGLAVSADIFQARISTLFHDLDHVYAYYLDDIIIIGTGTFTQHIKQVEEVLDRLIAMGLQVNPGKTAWMVDEVDYLGFNISREGIKPQKKKVKAVLKNRTPST